MFDDVAIVRSFETTLKCEITFTNSDFDGLLAKLFDVLLAIVIAQIYRPDIIIGRFNGLDERVSTLADKVVDAAVKCLEMIDSCRFADSIAAIVCAGPLAFFTKTSVTNVLNTFTRAVLNSPTEARTVSFLDAFSVVKNQAFGTNTSAYTFIVALDCSSFASFRAA